VDAILAARGGVDPDRILASLSSVEQTLLRLLLLYPEQQARTAARLEASDLPTTPARELWNAMLAERASPDATFVRERYLERIDPELRAIVIALLARREPVELDGQLAAQAIDQCLLRLERARIDEQVDHLRAELADAEARGDDEMRRTLLEATRSRETERADIDRRLYARSLLSRAPAEAPAEALST
jgi:hypothetical protein